ncbi:MAG: site-specific integrase [Clostridiales bacterium]|jgi:site-specific recombinase XerD|nr:site-specific integrase [Clostridiales bacterium]
MNFGTDIKNAKVTDIIMEEDIHGFVDWLKDEERAAATIEKYIRDIHAFAGWLGGSPATKESAVAYKEHLTRSLAPASVNAALAALNKFFAFMGWGIKVKPMKIQKQTFSDNNKEMTLEEYRRLLKAALALGKERMWLVLQVICATGIRVSELAFITIEAVRCGRAIITNKGKTRSVFIPKALAPLLLKYARNRQIVTGCIFITKNGTPLDRRNIWAEMKGLCAAADVSPGKVFPHNLRKLFAREFYKKHNDIVKLADILGHSDVKTTRIYVMETGEEHRKRVDELDLVAG